MAYETGIERAGSGIQIGSGGAIRNLIQVGRLNRWLQKLTGTKGSVPAPEVEGGFYPVIALPSGVEDRYVQGWHRFGALSIQNAVAAVNSGAKIRNPTSLTGLSPVIGVLERVTVYTSVADTPTVGLVPIDTADFATIDAAIRLDARIRPGQAGTGGNSFIVSHSSTVTFVGGGQFDAFLTSLTSQGKLIDTDDQEIPLLPGDSLGIISVAVNTQIVVGWRWRERVLEDSERT